MEVMKKTYNQRMASRDIREKIKDVLSQSTYSERDVVYFLVEAYKFLERKYDKEFGQGKYDRIKFYRNWTCHAQLYGDSNKVFVDFVELINAERSKLNAYGHYDWLDSMIVKIKERFRQYGPLYLKNDILEFLFEIGYNKNFNWESFRVSLYEVIQDIPLIIKDGEEIIFTFEAVEPMVGGEYNSLELRASICRNEKFFLTWDDHLL